MSIEPKKSPSTVDRSRHSTGATAARAIMALGYSKLAMAVISLAVTALLARLLTPAAFGLVGMVTVVTALFAALNSLGMDAAIIGKKHVSEVELSTLFWIKTGVGTASALILIGISEPLGRFYKQPDLAPLARLIALLFVTSSLYQIHRSLLRKDVQFKRIAQFNVISVIVGGVFAIGTALLGGGAWSLVIQMIAQDVASTILFWRVSPWRPSLKFDIKASRDLLRFGANMFGSSLALYLQRNMDWLIIGKLLGETPLGLYSLAYRIMYQPVRQISYLFTDVLFPVLSKIQDDLPRVRNAYRKSIKFTAMVTFPGMALIALEAKPLIRVAFGAKWLEAAPLLEVMAVAGAVQSIAQIGYLLFPAMNRPGLNLRIMMANCVVIGISVAIGSHWGVTGVAWGVTLGTISIWCVTQTMVNQLLQWSWTGFLATCQVPLMGCALMITVWAALLRPGWISLEPLAVRLVLECTVLASCYFAVLWWLDRSELAWLQQRIIGRRPPPPAGDVVKVA